MRSWYTIVLRDRQGFEITRQEDVTGEGGKRGTLKDAQRRAKYYLSDQYAASAETTHENWGTAKVEIQTENGEVVWDEYVPEKEISTDHIPAQAMPILLDYILNSYSEFGKVEEDMPTLEEGCVNAGLRTGMATRLIDKLEEMNGGKRALLLRVELYDQTLKEWLVKAATEVEAEMQEEPAPQSVRI